MIIVLLCTDTDRTRRETEMHNFVVNLHTLVSAERQTARYILFTQPLPAGTVTFINLTPTLFKDDDDDDNNSNSNNNNNNNDIASLSSLWPVPLGHGSS